MDIVVNTKMIKELVEHFLYSIKDIKNWEELTIEEKDIISEKTFYYFKEKQIIIK